MAFPHARFGSQLTLFFPPARAEHFGTVWRELSRNGLSGPMIEQSFPVVKMSKAATPVAFATRPELEAYIASLRAQKPLLSPSPSLLDSIPLSGASSTPRPPARTDPSALADQAAHLSLATARAGLPVRGGGGRANPRALIYVDRPTWAHRIGPGYPQAIKWLGDNFNIPACFEGLLANAPAGDGLERPAVYLWSRNRGAAGAGKQDLFFDAGKWAGKSRDPQHPVFQRLTCVRTIFAGYFAPIFLALVAAGVPSCVVKECFAVRHDPRSIVGLEPHVFTSKEQLKRFFFPPKVPTPAATPPVRQGSPPLAADATMAFLTGPAGAAQPLPAKQGCAASVLLSAKQTFTAMALEREQARVRGGGSLPTPPHSHQPSPAPDGAGLTEDERKAKKAADREARDKLASNAVALDLEMARQTYEQARAGQAGLGVMAIDVETFEFNHSLILEFGWSFVELDEGGAQRREVQHVGKPGCQVQSTLAMFEH